MKSDFVNLIALGALVVLLMGLGIALQAWIIQLIWNSVLISVFSSLTTITFGQSIGLSILLSVIGGAFKSSSSK